MRSARIIAITIAAFMAIACSFPQRPGAEGIKPVSEIIGYSVKGAPIEALRFGDGPYALVIVSGIHGFFEAFAVWHTATLLSELEAGTLKIPSSISLYVVPNMNPDAFTVSRSVYKKEPSIARFNAHKVDLNRNWLTSDWATDVSYGPGSIGYGAGGPKAFSEPETLAVSNFLLRLKAANPHRMLVISLHTLSITTRLFGELYPAYSGIVPNTVVAPQSGLFGAMIADAAGYKFIPLWTSYLVTGELIHWASENGIDALDLEFPVETYSWLLPPLPDKTNKIYQSFRQAMVAALAFVSAFY